MEYGGEEEDIKEGRKREEGRLYQKISRSIQLCD